MMDLETLRDYCLAKAGAEEGFPFGETALVFKAVKMFALIGIDEDPLTINLKCDPERAIELRERYECVKPGYHMNKKHWNTVTLDGSLQTAEIKELIDHSYNLVVNSLSKAEKLKLGGA